MNIYAKYLNPLRTGGKLTNQLVSVSRENDHNFLSNIDILTRFDKNLIQKIKLYISIILDMIYIIIVKTLSDKS